MKIQILIGLILLGSVLTVKAQWNGTNPIYTNSNIGIGTNSPLENIHIKYSRASLRVENTNLNDWAFIRLGSTTFWDIAQFGNNNYIEFRPGGNTSVFTIRQDKQIGIGTDSPLANLHIKSSRASFRIENTNIDDWAFFRLGSTSFWDVAQFGNNDYIEFRPMGNTSVFTIKQSGMIGIGTNSPTYKLDVIGTIRAREIKVDLNGADFVFEKDFKLMPLNELEMFVKEQKHLPEIAPAKEMEKNGTELGELNSKLLQKMEEMTLYMIEQNKKIETLQGKIEKLEAASTKGRISNNP